MKSERIDQNKHSDAPFSTATCLSGHAVLVFARYDTADSTRVRIFGSIYGSATTTTTTVDSPFWSPVSRQK